MTASSASISQVLGRVEDELRQLWAASPSAAGPAKARACTMNLVVVAATPAIARSWRPIVDDVVLNVPARAIVVGLDPAAPDSLAAETSAVCTRGEGGGPIVCSERVTLDVGGAVCRRIASCVDALRVTDVPTTLVWLGRVHGDDAAFAPLAREAERIVLDAAQGSLTSLAHVVGWAQRSAEGHRPGVADLAWTRLAPWQELCARVFDEPRLRGLATRVDRVTIEQASSTGVSLGAEGTLLLGWLATRLGWEAGPCEGRSLRLTRPDGAAVQATLRAQTATTAPSGALLTVAIEARDDGVSVHGEATREANEAQGDVANWRLRVTHGSDTQHIEQRVRLRASELAPLLERTLHRPMHDDALAQAVAWAARLRGDELACC